MTREKVELAMREIKDMLDRLAAESMASARRVQETKERIDALSGTIEEQWIKLQALRQELQEVDPS